MLAVGCLNTKIKMLNGGCKYNFMNIKLNYLLILLLVVSLTGNVLFYFKISELEEEVQKKEDITLPIISTPPEEVWKTYTSAELGFSIKYPEMVYGSSYRCDSKKPFYVPLKVFEDDKNEIVYIVKEYFYRGKYDEKLGKYIGPCEKITRSLKSLQGGWSGGWSILFRIVKNEDELNKFIKDNYGKGCFVGEKELWKQKGVYKIRIEGEDWGPKTDLGTTTCPWSYNYKILYAPKKNKLMSINLGQECGFGTDYNSEDYKCYDDTMIDSFRFK